MKIYLLMMMAQDGRITKRYGDDDPAWTKDAQGDDGPTWTDEAHCRRKE